MKLHNIYFVAVASVLVAFTGCKQDDPNSHDFTNKVFIEAAVKPVTIFVKESITTEATKTLRAGLADPASEDIQLTYSVAPQHVETYNAAFYDQAVMLPADNYDFPSDKSVILKGSVISTELVIHFKQLDLLDQQTVYVLPVMLTDASNMPILQRSRTAYYVFRGSALINIVSNLQKNYLNVKWKNPNAVNDLSTLTLEALICVHGFDRMLSTVLGIEGHFLLRIGDDGISSNQLQLATSQGNVPSTADAAVNLPTDQWVHIAVTYDATNSFATEIYLNGERKVIGRAHYKNVSFGTYASAADENKTGVRGFHIGYAYSEDRYLDGEIAEVRIWNRVLTEAQINAKNHFYYVDTASDGLVAYWKFDDGDGTTVKDHTINGNDATAAKPLEWIPAELPLRGK